MNLKPQVTRGVRKDISQAKYNELRYFCLQYDEKKGDPSRTHEMELIEETALAANDAIYRYILKNVTQGIKYEHMDVPCGRRQFYEARKLFFRMLSLKR
ncbi:MAG: hypothetical protein LBV33_05295 [Lachnospiraceae bacterium]|jgi:hypothetical protein|nr:hypothetical protein [Lachnospiraceae bacterium]